MRELLDLELPRTLGTLLARAERERPARLQAWLFEDEAARRDAEQQLAALGIEARLRSAYKPILHAFLEEFGLAGHRQVRLRLPAGQARRLRVESYPLAGLLEGAALAFEACDGPADAGRGLTVEVWLDGQARAVFVPLNAALAPVGWLRCWGADGQLLEDGPLQTDYQAAYEAVLAAVAAQDWPDHTPYFEQLWIELRTGGIERALPWGDEVISTREALHEDLYFTLLEFFQRRAGRAPGDRSLQPGQIVPLVCAGTGPTRLRLCLADAEPAAPAPRPASPAPTLPPLEVVERPLHPDEVLRYLGGLAGERFGARSHQGREVAGLYRAGALPGLVISGGQHANESAGVVAALRAAEALQRQPDAHYALVALENPDGAALHQRLCREHPRHMQHAARFTALGDDLEARSGGALGEKAARQEAIARTGAGLHFSLHGYPAHEWTRPFSGYLPPGAEDWTLPKGFFLIMRHHPDCEPWPFMEALTAALAQDPALVAYNRRQHALWRAHWGELPMPLRHDIPCLVGVDPRSRVPYTLITEFPDETVYGPAMRFAHETLTRTVLLGAALYWQGLLKTP